MLIQQYVCVCAYVDFSNQHDRGKHANDLTVIKPINIKRKQNKTNQLNTLTSKYYTTQQQL